MIEKFVDGGATEKCPQSRLYVQPGTLTPSAFTLEVHLNMKSLFKPPAVIVLLDFVVCFVSDVLALNCKSNCTNHQITDHL